MITKKRLKKTNWKGQSLFEVVLALGIISFIMVALISLTTVSVRNASVARNKTQANRLAQEGVEWLRGERDSGYDIFVDYVGKMSTDDCPSLLLYDDDPISVPQVQKCMCLQTNIKWNDDGACVLIDPADILEGNFIREASLKVESSNNRVVGAVIVSWSESAGDHATRLNTFLGDWRAR